jgi:drug/metabolite transporter (DMT)-like permease
MAFFAVPLLVWARYIVHLIVMLLTVAPHMGRKIIVTKHPGLMIFRALMLVSVSVLFQSALKSLPLAESTALIFLSPLLVALLSGPFLGEKLGLGSWLATIAGFGGMLLIARPGGAMFGIGVLYAFGSALCYAIYQIFTRKLSATEPPMRQLFYTALVGTISMSFVIPTYWTGEIPSLTHASLIASLGLCAGTGHFLFTRASRETPASTLSTLLYVQLIWAMLLGWFIFGRLPDLLTTLGMVIIGVSSLSIALQRSRTTIIDPAASQ